MGFTMMPTFSGAMQSIRREAVARASTALNILQQTGASIGTAVLTVLLASALTSRLGSAHGSLSSTARLSPDARAHIAPKMASAFGHTFWWALALLVVALISSAALPKQKPAIAAGEAPVPVVS